MFMPAPLRSLHIRSLRPMDADKVFAESLPFEQKALEVFRWQATACTVYKRYLAALNCHPEKVTSLEAIPFLPIELFKSQEVVTGNFAPAAIFESSGTTGATTSRHYIKDLGLYEKSFRAGFAQFYGDVNDWCILGLLPSYLERSSSSLVYMVQQLIRASGQPESGFYLYDHQQLALTLQRLEKRGQKTLLIGVTYALLDFAAAFPQLLQHTVIMETGGMKGRKKEMVREAVHQQLQAAFGVTAIHSEYGMTELLSQAYASAGGRFYYPGWMKALVREEDDPLRLHIQVERPTTGALNIIDLANLHSCAFIATEDVARLYPDGSFEILGRMDNTDIRGCSLMAL